MPQIIFNVSSENLIKLKEGFLEVFPKPNDYKGNENDWVKERVRQWIMSIYKKGKVKIQESIYDDNLFE